MSEAPRQPQAGDGLESSAGFDFVDLYLNDRAAGRRFDLRHYLERFPGSEEAVAREFLRLQAEQPGLAGRPRFAEPAAPAGATDRIGSYGLVRELGRGGQATVYLARDLRLERDVALKVLRSPAGFLSESRLRRFRREAAALARLNHSGICPVFDTDLEGDTPYIAMRHVRGATLARLIVLAREEGDAARTDDESDARAAAFGAMPADRLAVSQVLRIMERAARALHSAHEVGIVHRDVKPGNIMITREGEPVLLDFGLARGDEDAQTVTLPGEVFGTLSYMAPEQVKTPPAEADRRADVYALGVTLFECLTLRRPFEATTRESLLRLIETAPPPDARKLNPAVPPELAVVLEVALEKNPDRRYPTALHLAEDLRRVREYEPIHARPVRRLVRLRRWARRRPAAAVAAGFLMLMLLTGALLAAFWIHRTNRANARYRSLLLSTLVQNKLAREQPVFALLAAIHASRAERTEVNNNALLAALKSCRVRAVLEGSAPVVSPDGSHLATRKRDAGLIFRLEDGRVVHTVRHRDRLLALAFHPRGRPLVVTASLDGVARLTDFGGGRTVHEWRSGDAVLDCAFDPEGGRVALASRNGTATIWDVATGRRRRTLRCQGSITCVRFDPSGRYLLTYARLSDWSDWAGRDTSYRVWDTGTGALVNAFPAAGGRDNQGVFSPRGGGIALVVRNNIYLWNPFTNESRTLAHTQDVQCLAFSPDGSRLAAGYTRSLRLWDTARGSAVALRGHDFRRVASVAFRPDGERLLTSGSDGTARIWDVKTGRLLRSFKHAEWHGRGARWRPGHGEIVTSFGRRSTRIWSLRDRPGLLTLRGHGGPVTDAAFGPRGERVVTASADGTARIWSARSGRMLVTLKGHAGAVGRAVFSRDGERVLTASDDGSAGLWEAASGRRLVAYRGHAGPVRGAALGPAEARVLTWSRDGTARVWEVGTGRLLHVLRHPSPVNCATFSPDGRLVATGDGGRTVRLWDAASGRKVRTVVRFPLGRDRRNENVFDLAFSPDGRRLAVASETSSSVRIYDTATWGYRSVKPIMTPGSLAFDASGAWLLVAGKWRPNGCVVDVATAERSKGLRPAFAGAVTAGAWDPRGTYLLLASLDGSARLWRAADLKPWVHLTGHAGPLHHAAFSPDGTQVVTASEDHTARVWPVDPLTLALARKPRSLTRAEVAILVDPEQAFLRGVWQPRGGGPGRARP